MNTEEFTSKQDSSSLEQKETKKPLHGKFTKDLESRRKGFQEDTTEELSESDKGSDDQKVVSDLRKAVDLLNDKYMREVADKENMKRIMTKNASEAVEYAIKDFAKDIIGCCDNLERVLSTLGEDDDLHKGIKMTWVGFIKALEDHGVKRIEPFDQPFDPNFHQSISEVLDVTRDPGTVVEVKQAGYTIKGRLLRPAMVIISKIS